MAQTQLSTSADSRSGGDFDQLADSVRRRFGQWSEPRLFRTDVAGLPEAFLAALPAEERQHHTCSACRHFLREYGGLVTIRESGETESAMWHFYDAPLLYSPAVAVMEALVRKAKVTGVFLSSAPVWGQPVTGVWTHFAVDPSPVILHQSKVLTARQAMAAKSEDFRTLITALEEYPSTAVDQAVPILESDTLYRSEKCLGVARWLQALQQQRGATRDGRARQNLVWAAVATAPPGFCHVRSSMIGTLLDDIVAGLPFSEISRRFAAKMHPLQYQRPQAAPSAGNLAQAEKLVEQLGIASALRRRFARLEEVEALWRPVDAETPPAAGGVFGHLKPKDAAAAIPAVELPTQTMTWAKFRDTVLPNAARIELRVPAAGNFTALLTAADPDALPILQWDSLEKRNPVSWYVYHQGSPATQWGLRGNTWRPVTAVCNQPSAWNHAPVEHQGQAALFLLEGARDSLEGTSNALFPEILKAEMHAIRSTIEAYSKSAKLEGRDEASACGYRIQAGTPFNCVLRVTSKTGNVATYSLDRWD